MGNPEFEGQTKTRLGNPEVRKVVDASTAACVAQILERDSSTLNAILSKAIQVHFTILSHVALPSAHS